MITYIIISYLVMLGMIIQANKSIDSVTKKEWIVFIFSPWILPIIIGMMISNK